jgi:hypothetical protein
MMTRGQRTLEIERMLKGSNRNISAIARQMGVTRQRVRQIEKRLLGDYEKVVTESVSGDCEHISNSPMKALTINLTPSVHDALVEACAVANRKAPEEPVTILEYVEECIICHVVELGLLRKNNRRMKAEHVR